jgi:NADH:ubiquinone oxidoreductase subunit C
MSRLLTQIYLFEEIFDTLQIAFPDEQFLVEGKPIDDTFLILAPGKVRPVVELLMDKFDVYHLSTITGDDVGDGVRLLYHFWSGYGITLSTLLPYDNLSMPTLTDLIPGAAFYEREVQEMLGVMFEGLNTPGPMFLPDDWEDGDGPVRYPLRKNADEEK